MLERAQEELERARPAITAMETEQGLFHPRDCEIPNHGFDDPPPSYDQACKDDESPPLYETLGYGNVMAVFGAERASSTTANQNSIGRASEVTAHEAPSHSVLIPPNSRSAPPRQGSISDAAYISTTLQQIQNYVEEMRERFSQSGKGYEHFLQSSLDYAIGG
ncbi:unnamed protein product [Cylicostephanus goldi]|uniref:Uncharacterized protein n=1 Tax=Cylicostephanus goldi TaxID=71465 RepID=A0A3P7MYF1_CYLGO|nr:unnamed protein product [Cylicostephanus goldi]